MFCSLSGYFTAEQNNRWLCGFWFLTASLRLFPPTFGFSSCVCWRHVFHCSLYPPGNMCGQHTRQHQNEENPSQRVPAPRSTDTFVPEHVLPMDQSVLHQSPCALTSIHLVSVLDPLVLVCRRMSLCRKTRLSDSEGFLKRYHSVGNK